MAKKKQAGTERPYTWGEFEVKIEQYCIDNKVEMFDTLDYILVDSKIREVPIKSECFDFYSVTKFGGSEGIYTDFYIRSNYVDEPKNVITAKTLSESDDAFIRMNIMGAKICLFVGSYINNHMEEFTWTGYNVGYFDNGKRVPGYWCGNHDSALRHIADYKKQGLKPYIRNNETREFEEV